MMNRNQIQGFSLLFLLTVISFGVARHLSPVATTATQWVVLWAGIEGLLGFYTLSWAFRKSDNIFYSFFLGGTLFRLVSLGIITGLLYVNNVPLLIPLLSLVSLYFVFSLLQVPFITYGLW